MSSNPELNGVIADWPESETWEHIEGTEAIAAANAITASDGFFVSDHATGTIWQVRLPISTDDEIAVREWVTDPLLEGTGALPFPFPIGANGIVQRGGTVYVAVTEQSHIVAIPMLYGLDAGEPYVYIELPGVVPDGIAFDQDGNLYVADPPNHTLWKVDVNGEITAVADVDDGLSGPSSVALWEGPDGLVAYVSNQAIGDPSTVKHRPSIIAVDLDE
jgi:sugar lactone lactonase YvrE